MQFRAFLSAVPMLWASTASCQNENASSISTPPSPPQRVWDSLVDLDLMAALGPSQVPMSNSRGATAPSPCREDFEFLAPIYEISNATFEVIFYQGPDSERRMNFRLRDVANDYTMNCTWGPVGWSLEDSMWSFPCVSEDDPGFNLFSDRFLVKLVALGLQPTKPLSISQIWVCNEEDGSYPLIYEAEAHMTIDESCPREGDLDIWYPCNVTSEFPITAEATWRPPVHSEALKPNPLSGQAPAPVDPDPERTEDCTAVSFSYPYWIVDDFYFLPADSGEDITANSLNFTVTSRATGVKALCVAAGETEVCCEPATELNCSVEAILDQAEDPFQSGSSFEAIFRRNSHQLDVEQRWGCADVDGEHSVQFEASASTVTLPVYCAQDDGRMCTMDRTTVRGALTSPLQVSPAPILGPPNAAWPGCTVNSGSPSWTIHSLVHRHTWWGKEQGIDAHEERSLDVIVSNDANNYTASCMFLESESYRPLPPDSVWYPCFTESNASSQLYPIETYILFNVSTSHFALNQTWYCNDTEEATPLEFVGEGSVDIGDIYCGWTNTSQHVDLCTPNIGTGVIYPCDPHWQTYWCNGTEKRYPPLGQTGPTEVPGTLLSTRELPPGAFTEPEEPGYSCTAAAGAYPVAWRLQGWRLRTDWGDRARPNSTRTVVNIDLLNTVFAERPGGGSVQVSAGGSYLATPYLWGHDPTALYTSYRREFRNILGWTMRFDPVLGYMELTQSWYCDDKDPAHPIQFNATWNGFIDLNCTVPLDNGVEDPQFSLGIECTLVNGDAEVYPQVTNQTLSEPFPEPETI